MADKYSAHADLFRRLCEELGYAPDRVASVRLNATQVVVVEREAAGLLHITTYEPVDERLRLVARGPAIGQSPSQT